MENQEQKEALKADYLQSVMKDLPPDYHDANLWQKHFAYWGGYILQLISVVAFAYLLYETFCFIWAITENLSRVVTFGACFIAGILVEFFRRKMIEGEGERLKRHITITTSPIGKHYVATGKLQVSVVLTLVVISAIMIAMSAGGAWVFVQKNAPQKAQVKVTEVASPLLQDIKAEKDRVSALDKSIQHLQQSKANELKDHKSYVVWEGKEYLLPETKTRHEGYDRQIATMQAQRQKHMELIDKYEGKLSKTEAKVETQNVNIQSENAFNLYWYGVAAAMIWIAFELVLLWCLCYPFSFEQEVRKEQLAKIIALGYASQYIAVIEGAKHKEAMQILGNVLAIQETNQGYLFLNQMPTLEASVEQQKRKSKPTKPIGFELTGKKDYEGLYKHLMSGKTINRQTLGYYNFNVSIPELNAMMNAIDGKGRKVDAKIQDTINTFMRSTGKTIAPQRKKTNIIITEPSSHW